ncbi:hypothetical protein [Nonomuraea jiangxiensis]|nr:hypothetical protein [Nonomuraea jiangxiensis]
MREPSTERRQALLAPGSAQSCSMILGMGRMACRWPTIQELRKKSNLGW